MAIRGPTNQDRQRSIQLEQSQVDATWEGANQARRAVTVAILAAVVGVVSALVNVVVPYVQKHVEKQDMQEQLHDVKLLLLPEMEQLRDAVRVASSRRADDLAVRNEKLTARQAKYDLVQLNRVSEGFDRIIADQDQWISRLPRDLSVVKAIQVMKSTTRGLQDDFSSQLARLETVANPPPPNPEREMVAQREHVSFVPGIWPPKAYKNLLLLISLNTNEDDEPTAGPFVFASCDDRQYLRRCDELEAEAEQRFR